MKTIFLACVFFCLSLNSEAAEIAAGMSFVRPEQKEAAVGDVVQFRGRWEGAAPHDETSKSGWLRWGPVLLDLSSLKTELAEGGGSQLTIEGVVVQPHEGLWETALLPLGNNKLRLEMLTQAKFTGQLTEKDQQAEPLWFQDTVSLGGWSRWAIGLLLAIAAAALAALAYWGWKRWQKYRLAKEHNPEDELERTLHDLKRKLERMTALSPEQAKSWGYPLTAALKRYTERRGGVSVLDLTDREWLAKVEEYGMPHDAVSSLRDILRELDEVRYGKRSLPKDEAFRLLERSARYRDVLRPKEEAKR